MQVLKIQTFRMHQIVGPPPLFYCRTNLILHLEALSEKLRLLLNKVPMCFELNSDQ